MARRRRQRISDASDVREPSWLTAKHALASVARELGWASANVDVGFVTHIGRGISRDAFYARIERATSEGSRQEHLVALVPRPETGGDVDARIVHEVRLLTALAEHGVPLAFRIATTVRAARSGDRIVLVCDSLDGWPLELRAGRNRRVKPWEVLASVAAAVHAVDLGRLDMTLDGFSTCRDHGKDALRAFDGLEGHVASDARAWALEHLPPPTAATLIHGDLLGQNILLPLDGPPWVIDWEYAKRGDPAYDLAIVTRGARRPFQVEDGLAKLLDAYVSKGGAPIRHSGVRFHEICLAAHWYATSLKSDDQSYRPTETLAHLERVLKLACADRGG